MPAASQSTSLTSLMDAIQFVLQFNTELSSDYVIENYDKSPQRKGEPYCVYFRLIDESPFLYPGAGRLGSQSWLALEIVLYTRLVLDIAGSDQLWSRDLTRGGIVMRETIRNSLAGENLFASYNANTGAPTGPPITVEPCMQLPSPVFAKKDGDDKTFGEHRLYFRLSVVQPLTV